MVDIFFILEMGIAILIGDNFYDIGSKFQAFDIKFDVIRVIWYLNSLLLAISFISNQREVYL